MPSTFPRSSASELQEAYKHLEYFKRLSEALKGAQERIHGDLITAHNEAVKWEGRIEKLEGKAKV